MKNYQFTNKVWLVEDDEMYALLLGKQLFERSFWEVEKFDNGQKCIDQLKDKPNVVVLDYNLPDMNGLAVFEKIKSHSPNTRVIFLSAQKEIDKAIEVYKMGAFDYIVKTKESADLVENSIKRAIEEINLNNDVISLKLKVN